MSKSLGKQSEASTSSSSMLALKAMIAEQKASGKREEKKQPRVGSTKGGLWTRPNKGIAQRVQKDDAAWAKLNNRTAESVESKLKKKAEIYEKLQRGKTGGLSSKQLDNLLIDFDSKEYESSGSEESSVEEESRPTEDDPLVEITDEFGRNRQVRKSEVPRDYLHRRDEPTIPDDDPTVLRGPNISNFPVYEPSAERVAKIMEEAEEDPLNKHYDATNENRAKGAGFYQFSGDADARQQQMDELLRLRSETAQLRDDAGIKEGPQEVPEREETVLAKATAKRKRDLEERRAQLDAKRRKKEPSVSRGNDEGSKDAMAFLEKMSRELGS